MVELLTVEARIAGVEADCERRAYEGHVRSLALRGIRYLDLDSADVHRYLSRRSHGDMLFAEA
jgi:hypothetical protein